MRRITLTGTVLVMAVFISQAHAASTTYRFEGEIDDGGISGDTFALYAGAPDRGADIVGSYTFDPPHTAATPPPGTSTRKHYLGSISDFRIAFGHVSAADEFGNTGIVVGNDVRNDTVFGNGGTPRDGYAVGKFGNRETHDLPAPAGAVTGVDFSFALVGPDSIFSSTALPNVPAPDPADFTASNDFVLTVNFASTGDIDYNIFGSITSLEVVSQPIPTPAASGVGLIGFGLLGATFRRNRRRRSATI